jgi:membrane dipeptidase
MVAFVASLVDPDSARLFAEASTEVRERTRGKNAADSEVITDEVLGRMHLPVVFASRVADHIEHIRDIAGVEHVGIGSDFEGATDTDFPQDLADVSMYPNLFAELIRRGWTDRDLKLLAGGNLIRVLRQAEATAASLRSAPASLETLR